MFGMFKKKTEEEKLQELYKKLMQEAYQLSTVNRSQSDSKYAEAEEVLRRLDLLRKPKV